MRPPKTAPNRLPTPPMMMATKLGIIRLLPIGGVSPRMPAARTPARPAKRQPNPKFNARKLVDVHAKRRGRLKVARAGADADAEQRVAQQQIEPDRGRRGDADDEQPVAGDEEETSLTGELMNVRHFKGQTLRAPDRPRHVLDDQRQAERQQQAVERIGALIERPDQQRSTTGQSRRPAQARRRAHPKNRGRA